MSKLALTIIALRGCATAFCASRAGLKRVLVLAIGQARADLVTFEASAIGIVNAD
jgi:hypothetical protein